MSVYEWARQELRRSQDAAQEIGFDPGLTLRAMLSAVVQQSKGVRSFEDLADELQYLASSASGATGILCSSAAQAPRSMSLQRSEQNGRLRLVAFHSTGAPQVGHSTVKGWLMIGLHAK